MSQIHGKKVQDATNQSGYSVFISESCFPKIKVPFPPTIAIEECITIKDGKIPSKPPNCFIIYRRAYQKALRDAGCILKLHMVSVMASDSWKREPEQVKKFYKDLARQVNYFLVGIKAKHHEGLDGEEKETFCETTPSAPPNQLLKQPNTPPPEFLSPTSTNYSDESNDSEILSDQPWGFDLSTHSPNSINDVNTLITPYCTPLEAYDIQSEDQNFYLTPAAGLQMYPQIDDGFQSSPYLLNEEIHTPGFFDDTNSLGLYYHNNNSENVQDIDYKGHYSTFSFDNDIPFLTESWKFENDIVENDVCITHSSIFEAEQPEYNQMWQKTLNFPFPG